jgi:hypothetical protein
MHARLMSTQDEITTWPMAIVAATFLLGCLALVIAVIGFAVDYRKTKIRAAQEGDLRQLVRRYEQLAEKTMDTQQRTAADMSELRSRTASIEQILRTVE